MRILFVGDLREHTRTAQRLRAFERLGADVMGLTTHALQARPDRRLSLIDRVRYRLGQPPDVTGVNAEFARLSRGAPFDLLWVEKALTLAPRALRDLRRAQPGLRSAFFSEDDMTMRSNQSHAFRKLLPIYDVVYTTKSFNARAEELPRLGAQRVVYLPKTFDPTMHRPLAVEPREARALGGPVTFIGTFELERAEDLLYLARADVPVRVWGNGWEAWSGRDERLMVEGRAIYGADYVRAVCATEVNLGFLRSSSRDLHTDRSVEIPACGGFLLAERTSEHRSLFDEGREADFFGCREELVDKVKRWLAQPAQRRAVAARGRARALSSDYSHDRTLERVLRELPAVRRHAA